MKHAIKIYQNSHVHKTSKGPKVRWHKMLCIYNMKIDHVETEQRKQRKDLQTQPKFE